MKRQVLLLLILGIISLTARGQSPTKTSDVQCDTLKNSGQIQDAKRRPVNDYSGLNSLRARLANRSWDGHSDTTKVDKATVDGNVQANAQPDNANITYAEETKRRGEECTGKRYFDMVLNEGIPIGTPLLIFFKGGGTEFTDQSQMINIRNVAQLAKEYGFRIRVTGSADSATGSAERNAAVARTRAVFIADILKKEGVPEDCMEIQSVGGVDTYSPPSANRNCMIELVF